MLNFVSIFDLNFFLSVDIVANVNLKFTLLTSYMHTGLELV